MEGEAVTNAGSMRTLDWTFTDSCTQNYPGFNPSRHPCHQRTYKTIEWWMRQEAPLKCRHFRAIGITITSTINQARLPWMVQLMAVIRVHVQSAWFSGFSARKNRYASAVVFHREWRSPW